MMDDDFIVDVFEAADAFASGDLAPIERLLPKIERKEIFEDVPLLFFVSKSQDIFDFLEKRGVDFLQKNARTGDTFLHNVTLDGGSDIFEKVLAWYSDRGLIDASDNSGITALSVALKFGLIDRAERLIDRGADVSSVALNGVTPFRQALYCLEGEDVAISELNLLVARGGRISADEVLDLKNAAMALGRRKVADWIEGHMKT
jgi:ankyrin repeat protein